MSWESWNPPPEDAGVALNHIVETAVRSTEMAASIERSTAEQSKGVAPDWLRSCHVDINTGEYGRLRLRRGSRRGHEVHAVGSGEGLDSVLVGFSSRLLGIQRLRWILKNGRFTVVGSGLLGKGLP